jgi:hypothetical protein
MQQKQIQARIQSSYIKRTQISSNWKHEHAARFRCEMLDEHEAEKAYTFLSNQLTDHEQENTYNKHILNTMLNIEETIIGLNMKHYAERWRNYEDIYMSYPESNFRQYLGNLLAIWLCSNSEI